MKGAEKHMMCKKELKTVNIASPDQKEAIKQAELQMMLEFQTRCLRPWLWNDQPLLVYAFLSILSWDY